MPKKIFFPFFIGSLILTIFGASFADSGSQAKLNSALEQNVKITKENKDLKTSNSLMQKEIKKCKNDVTDLSKKLFRLIKCQAIIKGSAKWISKRERRFK
ncbi:hypothetical protein A9490_13695 [Bacillus thuringiensis]|uniref:hypothetical protein n=1 Tax=Bacillus thuringiensis TaxID=1428 RepID=UPI0008FE152B|nr:hypothetical protein [Bacillus thuringiensis]OJE17680.1 hypothetical protein A9490_13695 [Bacillus thuringiensis]